MVIPISKLKRNKHFNFYNPDPRLTALFENVRISTSVQQRIYEKYKSNAFAIVQENPYKLIDDIYGVGFIIADGIAMNCGIAANDEQRISAGIQYILNFEIVNMGHTCSRYDDLVRQASLLLNLPLTGPLNVVKDLLSSGVLIQVGNLIYSEQLYNTEKYVGDKLLRLLNVDVSGIDYKYSRDGLASDQWAAIEKLLQSNVFILTGAPGTGKTIYDSVHPVIV